MVPKPLIRMVLLASLGRYATLFTRISYNPAILPFLWLTHLLVLAVQSRCICHERLAQPLLRIAISLEIRDVMQKESLYGIFKYAWYMVRSAGSVAMYDLLVLLQMQAMKDALHRGILRLHIYYKCWFGPLMHKLR
jgi:hypothetical protein